ncbi:hypothetical protein EUGRSUZ_H04408 [Eucalyptus grandis]|uniref:Uncharacterized protein n=2 Tax=Eucalyptus grandis TaxID=71139 RepID=A0ACC3JXX1_EUCGR|nr:hypothetical protein EUGRSUZ_H04408 [Eucalyptus grandis]
MQRLDNVIFQKNIALSWTSTSASPRVQSGGPLLTLSSSLCTFSSAPVHSLPPPLFAVTDADALPLFGLRRKLSLSQCLQHRS